MSFLLGVFVVPATIFAPFAFFWVLGQLADLAGRISAWVARDRVGAVLLLHDQLWRDEQLIRDAIDLDLMDIALSTCRHCRWWNGDADRAEFQPCPSHEGLFTT